MQPASPQQKHAVAGPHFVRPQLQALCVNRKSMKRILLASTIVAQAACNSNEQELASDLNSSVLKSASFTSEGKTNKCNPSLLQPELVSWANSFSTPKLASYPTTNQNLNLSFSNGSNYNLQVFAKQGFNYSLVSLPKLFVGRPLNLVAVCNT